MTKRVETVLSSQELLDKEEAKDFKVKFIAFKNCVDNSNFLDYEKTKEELSKMTFIFSEERFENIEAFIPILDRIQAHRDRTVAIYIQANEEHLFIKEHYDNLYKIWVGKYSDANSLDRREGESADILYPFLECRVQREVLIEAAKQVVYNLTQQHNTVVSKIKTVAQSYIVHGAKTADMAFIDTKTSLIKKRDSQEKHGIEESNQPQQLKTVEWEDVGD